MKKHAICVLLVSSASLAHQIILMQLFSLIQWHHFAYMIISMALLGLGVSGTILVFLRQSLYRHFEVLFSVFILYTV